MDDDFLRRLIECHDFGAELDALLKLREKGARQPVHAAFDLAQVPVESADIFGQPLDKRVVHLGFRVLEQAERLASAVGETLLQQKLFQRELAVLLFDGLPAFIAVALYQGHQVLDGIRPQVGCGSPALVQREIEAEQVRVRCVLGAPYAFPIDKKICLRVANGEGTGWQPEMLDIAKRAVVYVGYAHRADLGIQAGSERFAQRMDASTDPVARLQNPDLMSRALQLVTGTESRHSGAQNQDLLARCSVDRQSEWRWRHAFRAVLFRVDTGLRAPVFAFALIFGMIFSPYTSSVFSSSPHIR